MTLDQKVRLLPPERQAEVEDFVEFLLAKSAGVDERATHNKAVSDLVDLFGTIDYDPSYDYRKARKK